MGNAEKETTTERGTGKSLGRFLMSPALLLLPITGIVYVCGKGVNMSVFPIHFSIFLMYIYCALALVHHLFRKKDNIMASSAASAVANGVLFIFLSGVFQAPAFTWLGFALLFIGMLMVIAAAAPPQATLFARKIESIIPVGVNITDAQKILDSIPFPCVFLEKDSQQRERIVAANKPFAVMTGREKDNLAGTSVNSIIPMPLKGENISFAGNEWSVKRTSKGQQALVAFTSAEKLDQSIHFDVFDAIDPITGLYTCGFMKYKARSDTESVIRGKRRMSVALFKLSFHEAEENEVSDSEKKVAYAAFGRLALASIRVCDSAYLTGDGEVLVYMPDTPQSGAKVVSSRIHAGIRKTKPVECPKMEKARLFDVTVSFTGGVDLPGYTSILEEMRIALLRNHRELALTYTSQSETES